MEGLGPLIHASVFGPFVAPLFVLGVSLAEAEVCSPSAALDGPASLVAEVARALRARELGTAPRCANVEVRISGRPGAVTIDLRDRHGRRAIHAVAHVSTAATIIESWARLELSAPLLRAPKLEAARPMSSSTGPAPSPSPAAAAPSPSPVPSAAPMGPAPSPEPSAAPIGAAPSPVPVATDPKTATTPSLPAAANTTAGSAEVTPRGDFLVLLNASAEFGAGSSGDLLAGARFGACAMAGWVCLGLQGQVSGAVDNTPDAVEVGGLLAEVALPLRFGDFALAPAIAAGVGWFERDEPRGSGGFGRGRGNQEWVDPILALRLQATYELGAGVALAADVSVSGDPLEGRHFAPSVRGGLGVRWGIR